MALPFPRLRLLQALAISIALVAGTASVTVAAVADVHVGGGTTVGTPDSGATPSMIRQGNVVGFYLWAKNFDNANLSSFFLTAKTDMTLKGAYWWAAGSPNDVHSCDTTHGLDCQFGAFNSGAAVQVLVAYLTTKSDTSTNCGTPGFAPAQGTSAQCVHFQWGSNSGFVPDKNKKGNNSRGDAYDWYDFVTFSSSADAAAGFPWCDPATNSCAGLTVSNVHNLGTSNPQWTQATVPSAAANSQYASSGIQVADGSDVNFTCPTAAFPDACAATTLGQVSQIQVNQGSDWPYGQQFTTLEGWVQVDVGIYGVNSNQINVVYHFYQIDDPANPGHAIWQLETIYPCSTASDPAPTGSTACFNATGHGHQAQVTFWTHHNGFGKFG